MFLLMLWVCAFGYIPQAWAGTWQSVLSCYERTQAISTWDNYVFIGTGSGKVLRYDGSNWVQLGCSLGAWLRWVGVNPDGTVWAGCDNGSNKPILYKWNGSTWTAVLYAPSWASYASVQRVVFCPDNTIWAEVSTVSTSSSQYYYYWNGTTWRTDLSPGLWTSKLKTLSDGTPAVLSSNRYTILRWNGSSWVTHVTKPSDLLCIDDFVANPDGSLWCIGPKNSDYRRAGLYLYKNGAWNYKGDTFTNGYAVSGLVRANDGGVWVVVRPGSYLEVDKYNGSSFVESMEVNEVHADFVGCDITKNGSFYFLFETNSQYAHLSRYTPGPFELMPSPSGATGILTVKPKYDGSQIIEAVIQQSTDGTNFTDLFTCVNGSSSSVYVAADNYWFRLKWTWSSPYSYAKIDGFTNTVTVPALLPVRYSGVAEGLNWHLSEGRGYVLLSWSSNPNASGYRLWVFDGNAYRMFELGKATSWDSRVARIYPTESQLDSYTDNSQTDDLFNRSGTGLDLRDDPNKLYRKTVGTTYDDAHNYWFRVSAYNSWMESDMWANCYSPVLPTRTDAQEPTGSVNAISREGLKKTYDPNITLLVNAFDSGSGIWKVELSNDGVSYTQVYAATKNADGGTSIASYSNTFDWTVPLGAGTKIIYVRVTDAVGNQKVVTDTIALAEDMLPPSVTLTINGGAESTTGATVTLTLTVQDNASTASQMRMRFSNDGNLWSSWEPFQQTKSWNITSTSYGGTSSAGIKKVYAQVCDQAQNVALAVAEIGYNPTPPSGTVTIVGGSSGTWNGQPALFTKSDSPVLNLNYSGASQVRFDPGTGMWGDWESYKAQKVVYLVKSQGACRLRVQVKDAYGVAGTPQEFIVVVDPIPPTIDTLRGLAGATATRTSSVTLEITASDNLPGTLQYSYQINGGSWTAYANLTGGTITVSGLSSGVNVINVSVKDLAGNASQKSVTIFKI